MSQTPNPGAVPVLYSFRRCPYAIRARLALAQAGIAVELREVLLRDKPAQMLAVSAKATVPVLHLADGRVLDESLDIMHWALGQQDSQDWLGPDPALARELIARNDGSFKADLDRYKYHPRFPQQSQVYWRTQGAAQLQGLDARLARLGGGLLSAGPSLADIAIFPFVRQFRGVDTGWFDAQPWPALHAWLTGLLDSPLFARVMRKQPVWRPEQAALIEAWDDRT